MLVEKVEEQQRGKDINSQLNLTMSHQIKILVRSNPSKTGTKNKDKGRYKRGKHDKAHPMVKKMMGPYFKVKRNHMTLCQIMSFPGAYLGRWVSITVLRAYCYYIFTLRNIGTCDESDYQSTYLQAVRHSYY